MAKLKALSLVTVDDILADYADTDVTGAELAKLDGVTATTTELNYIDGATSAIQGQLTGLSSGANWSSNIVTGTGANDTSTTSTGYVQFASTQIAITPTNQTSRIMLIMRYGPHLNSYSTYRTSHCQVLRGSTVLDQWNQMRTSLNVSSFYNDKTSTGVIIDHPNTTSETTYYWQGKCGQSSANMFLHHSWNQAVALKMMAVEINSGQSINWV